MLTPRLPHEVPCDVEGCDARLETLTQLESHRKRTHHLGQGPGFLEQCQACNEVSGEYFLRN